MPPQDAEYDRWFSEEVQQHESSLRAYLHLQFPQFPDIDDLIQETYYRLMRARECRPVKATRPFLFATARNAALDYFRRRRTVTINGIADIESLSVIDDRPGVAESACRENELQILAEAIQSLPERCRLVITLRKVQGLSHREISEKLKISENTVNAQMAVGVIRIRDYLRERGIKEGSR